MFSIKILSGLRKLSIQSKMSFLILIILITSLGFTSLVLGINQWLIFRRIATHSVSTLARVIGKNSIGVLEFNDKKAANDILSGLASEPEITLACVYTQKQELFATYSQNNNTATCPIIQKQNLIYFEGKTLHLSAPIFFENETIGTIYLRSNLGYYFDALKIYFKVLLAVFATVVISALWFSRKLQRLIIAPILKLASTATLIAENKDYSVRADEPVEEELKTVVHAFNQMLAMIQETEKKQAEVNRLQLAQEQTARADAEKGVRLRDDFISIASHELKTPLTALKMQIQIIPRILQNIPFAGKEKYFSLFQNASHQLDLFSKLVDELLDVSRITAGRLVLRFEKVNLSEIIFRVIEHYKAELQSAGCSIHLDVDKAILGQLDPVRIEQVIVNLLTNAMKYGAEKPIEIIAHVDNEHVNLSIRDHGIGMTAEDQSKIFERFERVAPVTKFRGLGLGLFITREIVHAHGGHIKVESELGKGSYFTVELPLNQKV